MKRKRLGEALQERGKITAASLQQLFREQDGKVIRLGELILERGLVEKSALVDALQEVTHTLYLDCSKARCEKSALEVIPVSLAQRLAVLPIRMEGLTLTVAMVEPQNLAIIDELKFKSGMAISPRLAFRSEVQAAIARNYQPESVASSAQDQISTSQEVVPAPVYEMEFISTSARQANRDAMKEVQVELTQKRTPAIRLVSEIIREAITKQASDIHVEPQATETAVRIRVDGVLRELDSIPRNVLNSVISRIKILADMDIGERRAPQDGRFTVVVGPHKVDMRVSTLPTQYGEKIVMRLLETDAPLLSFGELGFEQEIADRMSRLLAMPHGMLLVTGPTGSGKSTTLYSALNMLRKPAVNIVTVEDPVEYVLPGINQVHVNTRAGLTFAVCLRSILRQDPNVIMVGEIRDLETAEIAVKAAQTGHLLLSTLHTNDTISAVARLLDLGVPDYLIASSLSGILAQRLVRRLCSCRTYDSITPEHAATLGELGETRMPNAIARPVGCADCDHAGYKGRVGIYELLVINDPIRAILRSGFRPDLIRDAARAHGMKSLQEDALEKLRLGITTVEEIQRVIPLESLESAECAECARELFSAFHYCPYCGTKRQADRPASLSESTFTLADTAFS